MKNLLANLLSNFYIFAEKMTYSLLHLANRIVICHFNCHLINVQRLHYKNIGTKWNLITHRIERKKIRLRKAHRKCHCCRRHSTASAGIECAFYVHHVWFTWTRLTWRQQHKLFSDYVYIHVDLFIRGGDHGKQIYNNIS